MAAQRGASTRTKLSLILPHPLSPDSPSILGTFQAAGALTDEPQCMLSPQGPEEIGAQQSPSEQPSPGLSRRNTPPKENLRTRRRLFSFSKDEDGPPNHDPWRCGEKFRFPLSSSQDDGHWDTLHKLGRAYDIERCRAWREEIEKVIIFVTLFAAIVVAFLVISVLKLRDDPQDAIKTLIWHQVQQQDAYFAARKNGTFEFARFTAPPIMTPYEPSASVIRQNGAMLLSITISLSAVMIGMICLQWIREYERDSRLGPKEGAALRQMKVDGFEYWRVPLIISCLPILPQVAVGVFFWGLTEMIWGMNWFITTLNLIVVGLLVFFLAFTSVAPAIQNLMMFDRYLSGPQVPFKSILSRCFTVIVLFYAKTGMWLLSSNYQGDDKFSRRMQFISKMFKSLKDTSVEDWVAYDMAWQSMRSITLSRISATESRDVPRVIEWVANTHIASRQAITAIYGATREMYSSTSMQVLRRLMIGGRLPKGPRDSLEGKVMKFVNDWKLNQEIPQDLADEGIEDVLEDLKGALILDKLVKNNPQLQSALLEFRTELFIRVLNHNAYSDPHNTKPAKRFNIWRELQDEKSEWSVRLLVPFTKSKEAKDYLVIDDSLKAQIIATFKAYLHLQQYHEMLWKVTLTLVLKTVTCQSSAEPELLEQLDTFNHELSAFMGARLNPPNGRHNPSMPAMSARIMLLEYVQMYQHFSAIRGHPSSRTVTLNSFTQQDNPPYFPPEICSGRSEGLFGEKLKQFDTQLKELERLIGSPDGLGTYPVSIPTTPVS